MTDELIALTQKLLDAIAGGDWATYHELCADDLTAFEPEAPGQLVVGLDFHRFYFDPAGVRGRHHTTMCNPQVRLMGDVAVVTYGRVVQRATADGRTSESASVETRVWQRTDGAWKHVHFHRTGLSG